MKPRREESILQANIVELLRRLGFWVQINTSGHRGRGKTRAALGAGAPDLLVGVGKGQIIWLETKRAKGGRLSDDQLAWHANARRFGMKVEVVSDVNSAATIIMMNRRLDQN